MSWEKIKDAPNWLEFRRGVRKHSYRVNYRAEGIKLVKKIEGDHATWRKAKSVGEDMIAKARLEGTPDAPELVRCEELLNEMVAIVKAKALATYAQKEIMARVHLIPWLNSNCAYAKDLNGATWDLYRSFKRRQNPNVTLKAHAEVFGGLCVYAFKKGIVKSRFKLDYDRDRDDFAEPGKVIPKDHLMSILKACPEPPGEGDPLEHYANALYYFEAWRDRIILQRATGMRPGEARLLRKDRITILGERAIIRLRKEDTKTREARPVPVKHKLAVEILKLRIELYGDVLFPQRNNPCKPMSSNLSGWNRILERAKVCTDYTPHDLRHTYLTEMFKNSKNPALICFTCGLSLEEAQETYLHFSEDDAMLVSDEAAVRLSFIKELS